MAGFPDKTPSADEEMRAEYDFHEMGGVVRGKYADAYKEHLRVYRPTRLRT